MFIIVKNKDGLKQKDFESREKTSNLPISITLSDVNASVTHSG